MNTMLHNKVSQPAYRIGVLFGFENTFEAVPHPFISGLVEGIRAAAHDRHVSLLVSRSIATYQAHSSRMYASPYPGADRYFIPVSHETCDGLLVILGSIVRDADYYDRLLASGYPLQFVGHYRLQGIGVDNQKAMDLAVEHLLEHGCRRIAFLGGIRDSFTGNVGNRLQCFQQAIRRLGLVDDPALLQFGQFNRSKSKLAFEQLLALPQGFDGIVASNLEALHGILESVREKRLQVPGDFKLVSSDEQIFKSLEQVPITTINHHLFKIGYMALEHTLKRMKGELIVQSCVSVEPGLDVRGSCGCPVLPQQRFFGFNVEVRQLEQVYSWAEPMRHAFRCSHGFRFDRFFPGLATRILAAVRQSIRDQSVTAFESYLLSLSGTSLLWNSAFLDTLAHFFLQAIHGLQTSCLQTSDVQVQAPVSHDTLQVLSVLQELCSVLSGYARQLGQRERDCEEELNENLAHLNSDLRSCSSIMDLVQKLAVHVPKLGVNQASLAFFVTGTTNAKLNHERCTVYAMPSPELGGRDYPVHTFLNQILTPGRQGEQHSVFALVVAGNHIGYCVLGTADLRLGSTIVRQIVTALESLFHYLDAVREKAEKERFLSMVSHEFRTPLALMIGHSELLSRSASMFPDQPVAGLRSDIEHIHASSIMLDGLVRDVLDMDSLDRGSLMVQPEPVTVQAILEPVVQAFRVGITARGLRFNVSISANLPPVFADAARIRQVIINLLRNAMKFTSKGSIDVQVAQSGTTVGFAVQDTGQGIAPADFANLFTAYHRSTHSSQGNPEGLGLGLFICHSLLEKHGAELRVQSRLGNGSCFSFALPVYEQSSPQVQTGMAEYLLLLHDGSTVDPGLQSSLQELEYAIHALPISPDFSWLDTLPPGKPALVLFSIKDDKSRIWPAMQALKSSLATRSAPVIIHDNAGPKEAFSMLEIQHAAKPLSLDVLMGMVRQRQTPLRILLVDDDADMVHLHARLIREQFSDVCIYEAFNGEQALALLGEQTIDLVLLDLVMPQLDGFAVLKAMAADQVLATIPVIVLTAHTLAGPVMEQLEHGVRLVLNKRVFTATETMQRIKQVLDQRRETVTAVLAPVARAVAYIETNYHSPASLVEIATQAAVSVSYLNKCFTQAYGLSVMAYLQRFRLDRACELLLGSSLTLVAVATRVGFSDPKYFARVFQRAYGQSPRVFRSKNA